MAFGRLPTHLPGAGGLRVKITPDRVFGLVLAIAKRRHTAKQPLQCSMYRRGGSREGELYFLLTFTF